MRIKFDSTLDDFVHIYMHDWARSKQSRSVWWKRALVSSGPTAVVVAWLVSGPILRKVAFGLLAGSAYFAYFVLTYDWRVRRATRRMLRKQLGSEGPFPIEYELTEAGLFNSQLGVESIYEWRTFDGIEEREDAVYLYMGNRGLHAVNSSGFATREEKRDFYLGAKRYIDQVRRAGV